MKLLLDAPEHLWRLIERKRYFSAAWLFLLSRVVHRALVREDDQDHDGWHNQGINVLVRTPSICNNSGPDYIPNRNNFLSFNDSGT
jgi:hypothetical protein